jgi:hypothetical protein
MFQLVHPWDLQEVFCLPTSPGFQTGVHDDSHEATSVTFARKPERYVPGSRAAPFLPNEDEEEQNAPGLVHAAVQCMSLTTPMTVPAATLGNRCCSFAYLSSASPIPILPHPVDHFFDRCTCHQKCFPLKQARQVITFWTLIHSLLQLESANRRKSIKMGVSLTTYKKMNILYMILSTYDYKNYPSEQYPAA